MYADGTSGDKAERPMVEERRREVVALVDVRREDRLALAQSTRSRGSSGGDHETSEPAIGH